MKHSDDGVKRNAPVLHLIAHGFELLFKAELAAAGVGEGRLKNEFGHDLSKMWETAGMAAVRHRLSHAANEAFDGALADPFLNVEDPYDRAGHFEEQLRLLSDLHSKASKYALRYPETDDGIAAPFMADMLDDLVRDSAKRKGLALV